MFITGYNSRILFAPNTVFICGQEVQSIQWETRSRDSDETLWQMLSDRQAMARTWTQQEFCRQLAAIKKLSLWTLCIQTDANLCEIHTGSKEIVVTLNSGQAFSCKATPAFAPGANEAVQVIQTALYLLTASTPLSVKQKLSKLALLGFATQTKQEEQT